MAITFRPLKADEVECRVGTCSERGVSLLLYKDARCDMALLDETVGPENWQCDYDSIDGKLFCTVGIKVMRTENYYEWIYKQDVGVPSNMESTKGEASDAFKRACFKWGIGRELYTAPFIWIPADKCNITKGKNGKPQCYDDFRVTEMEVEDGEIVKLTIRNMKRRGEVVYGTESKQPEKKPGRYTRIAELKQTAMDLGISEQGIKEWLDATFGKPMSEFTDQDIFLTVRHLEEVIDGKRKMAADA